MHKLIIHKLGPVERCEFECSPFMTLTGFQASGKSTIAKAIYYFRTIKEDIIELVKKQAFQGTIIAGMEDPFDVGHGVRLRKGLENYLREKFLNIFGSSWGMSGEMRMEYFYTETCFIKILLKQDPGYQTPNDIWITFSEDLKKFLRKKDHCFTAGPLGIPEEEMKGFQSELYRMFDDCHLIVYIPAGRSMITLLSQQLGYIYAQMDDVQKRSLDGCTKDYLERILRLKPEFSSGLQALAAFSARKLPLETMAYALDLIKMVLRGTYRYSNGEEQIVLDDGKYVKINFSSSGQQECVWILNLLFYYLLQQRKVMFIIEEPESHLFPASQKYITEMIALVKNHGHSVLLTTHSPYVLGTLNNLLYAATVQTKYPEKADEVIPQHLRLDFREFAAWFVKNGMIEDCMDSEIHMIQNERIDEISKVINEDFDRLLDLQEKREESAN